MFRGVKEQSKRGKRRNGMVGRGRGKRKKNLPRNRGDYETECKMRLFRTGPLKERKEG